MGEKIVFLLFDRKNILEKYEVLIKFVTHYGIPFPARAPRRESRTERQ